MDIANQINSCRNQQVLENRARLTEVSKGVIFGGRRNIPRGHRDNGAVLDAPPNLEDDVETVEGDAGHYRALLRYSVQSGNKTLEEHLRNPNAKATYIGGRSQNELIECCGQEIIMERVKAAPWFSIIDETTDISRKEQTSTSFRYVHEKKICEDFFLLSTAMKQCDRKM